MIANAVLRLSAAGVPSPQADAVLLAEHVTGIPGWRLRLGCAVAPELAAQFEALVSARATRIPTQHLTGTAYFRHLRLRVGPGVFLPRPETELLVDHVRDYLVRDYLVRDYLVRDYLVRDYLVGNYLGGPPSCPVVVDLCTGSGAIAISVATEIAGARVLALELDPVALSWAQANAGAYRQQINAAGSVLAVFGGDATMAAQPHGGLWHLRGRVDVIVTNPPYIPQSAIPRDPEVRDHDPALALYGGRDGLDVVRALVDQAALLLRPGGLLVVEHADDQGDAAGGRGVPGLLRAKPDIWTQVEDQLDLAGRPRHTSARRMPG